MRLAHRNDTLHEGASDQVPIDAMACGALEVRGGVTARDLADPRVNWRVLRRAGLACAIGLAVLALLVATGMTAGVDDLVHDGAVQLRTAWLTPIARALSDLMTPVPLAVMGAGLVACAHTRRLGVAWACNVCTVALLNVVLKALVERPRPEEMARLVDAAGYSFPSGHSAVSMAAFGFLAWFIWHGRGPMALRTAGAMSLVGLAVLIGASRVYLGVHYLSDVLAGFCEAGMWLALYVPVVARCAVRPIHSALRGGERVG